MNRLADESSPYLQQHADNPVDWYPWGEDAFAVARERDVPVLLSVGYSACHWCHVMAHESFEDEGTAADMNAGFVNVKVDREERPDVDSLYMEAVQAMTGRGGWPMTVFLTPDGVPFFGGTYFPPERRGQTPSFRELLTAIGDAWTNRRDELLQQGQQLVEAVGRAGKLEAQDGIPPIQSLDAAYANLKARHDDVWGGFGGAPKFPTPQNPDFLVRTLARNGSAVTRAMVETTLDAMASGGMYDHLGGGFSRYGVDQQWVVPHFEKMLYDQAGLVRLYTHGFQVTGHERYRQVVEETVEYVLRDLRLGDDTPGAGAIASAEDADSRDAEGRLAEGAFYSFTPDEVRQVLADDPEVAEATIAHYELDRPANFEGKWIPVRTHSRGEWERSELVDVGRQRLFEHRNGRARPGLDDKVLTEWNGHWIAALAEAGGVFDRTDWTDAAVATAEFLLEHLRRDDGRWLRAWQERSGAKTLAFAGDHAALVDAFTRLGEVTGERRWTDAAVEAAEWLIDLFWDEAQGGLFTTGHDAEQLIARDKDVQDNAVPSANSTAAVSLLRLGALTGNQEFRDRAEDILKLTGRLAVENPVAFGVLLQALDLHHAGSTEIVVVDRPDLATLVMEKYLPNTVLAWGERGDGPLWDGRTEPAAYVCRNHTCGLPAATAEELDAQLALPPR